MKREDTCLLSHASLLSVDGVETDELSQMSANNAASSVDCTCLSSVNLW